MWSDGRRRSLKHACRSSASRAGAAQHDCLARQSPRRVASREPSVVSQKRPWCCNRCRRSLPSRSRSTSARRRPRVPCAAASPARSASQGARPREARFPARLWQESDGAEPSDADACRRVLALAGKGMSLIGPSSPLRRLLRPPSSTSAATTRPNQRRSTRSPTRRRACSSHTPSPFSVAANGVLESTASTSSKLGLEWFLLGPKAWRCASSSASATARARCRTLDWRRMGWRSTGADGASPARRPRRAGREAEGGAAL